MLWNAFEENRLRKQRAEEWALIYRGHILKSLASSPQKLPCPRLEDSTLSWGVKSLRSAWKIFWKTFFVEMPENFFWRLFFWDRLINFSEDFFFVFVWRALALVSLGLGLEHSCPWPQEGLSSVGLSLASVFFFCDLGLEPFVLDSTSAHLLFFIFRFS